MFFIASKLIGMLLRPDTWIIIAVAAVVLALLRGRHRRALSMAIATLVALLTLAIFPLGSLLLHPIEQRYAAAPALSRVDGIIVLGGGEDTRASAYWGQMQFNEAGDRFAAGLALAKRHPDAKLLFAGGSGALRDLGAEALSEASLAERFFLDQGISSDRLLLEARSRNTAENARMSLAIATPGLGETWVLVTSAFHMPRAMRSFEAAGWPELIAWPVDYRTSRFKDDIGWDLTGHLQVLNTGIREWVGQLAYRWTGR